MIAFHDTFAIALPNCVMKPFHVKSWSVCGLYVRNGIRGFHCRVSLKVVSFRERNATQQYCVGSNLVAASCFLWPNPIAAYITV